MAMTPSPARHRRLWAVAALLALILAAAFLVPSRPQPSNNAADMTAVLQANNRGIGRMERFEYDRAIEAFGEVQRLAPGWLPGRINLGIALLNEWGSASSATEELSALRDKLFERAVGQFLGILRDTADNRYRTYAHHCLAVLYLNAGDAARALPHAREVTERDPRDAHGWYYRGRALEHVDNRRAAEYCERAMRLDPYLGGAFYSFMNNPYARERLPEKQKRALDEYVAMDRAKDRGELVSNAQKDRYSELGFYAECLDPMPRWSAAPGAPLPLFLPPNNFQVRLAPGARWASAADFGKGDVADLRRALRRRFGGVVVVLDYNGDNKIDIFMVGAVVERGVVRNLLLRNDGDGNFTDVTAAAGLAGPHASLACTVADFNNDGYPDIFLSGAGSSRLFRNRRDGTFDDVTTEAGLHSLSGVCLGATFADVDLDGDLDLLVARCASTPAEALRVLRGETKSAGGLVLYVNKGEARAVVKSEDPEPLQPSFREQPVAALATQRGPVVAVAASDVDRDQDLDFLILGDATEPTFLLNDRLLRFHRTTLPQALVPRGAYNGALVLDANHHQESDLLLLRANQSPLLLIREATEEKPDAARWFRRGPLRSPPLRQAQAIDLDLDGLTDVVGLSADGRPVLLHNRRGRLTHVESGLGTPGHWPRDLIAICAADFNGDGQPDVLAWSEREGLCLRVSKGNSNLGLQLLLIGHRRVEVKTGGWFTRCNSDGFGVRVAAFAADHWTALENTTLSAGLGQSRQPLFLGLGHRSQAEVTRLRWPDNCWQAEFNLTAGSIHRLDETNRKKDSCPVLFTWNGDRHVFVTDFLGAGSVGESQADGGTRKPRPEESVKIEADQLRPRDGQFVLKIAEPMSELTYLDRLQLLVLDHPEKASVFPDERFATSDPPPTQDLLSFERTVAPISARNHRGQDVTGKLKERDRDMVDAFARRSWLGFAEEHWVELDFGDRLKAFSPQQRLVLFLAGWTDYAYPESIWAAAQAGVAALPPLLERRGTDGKWHALADLGFPAGLPRTMTYDLTGKLGGERCVLRIRTNLHVYWDRVFVAPVVDRIPPSAVARGGNVFKLFRATPLEVSRASLYARGFMQEFSPDGKLPTLYDYNRLEPMMVNRQKGNLTRFGDVTELLRMRDDRFVIFGPGDEVEVRFDATGLPPLPKGWKRSYVLKTWGYCKDTGPFTATGDTVAPLPFAAMSNYPYGPGEKYPDTPQHRDYLRRYNTRQVGRLRR